MSKHKATEKRKVAKRLYIFDKDGTICRSKSGQKFINSVADQELIPGVAEKCAELRAQGHALAVASNQGGVAWGFMSLEDAYKIVAHAARLIGATTFRFCPHHPDAPTNNDALLGDWCDSSPMERCEWRKPQPGMIIELMNCCGFGVSPEKVTFIGDMEADRQAAEAAGVEFVWAWGFFGRPKP